MEKTWSNKKVIAVALAILVVLAAAFAVIYKLNSPKPQEGSKAYTVVVVDDSKTEKQYEGKTDAEYVGDMLRELEEKGGFKLEGDESDYGFYITAVNGLKADFAVDGAYWAFYLNDEYAQNGIDTQILMDGDKVILKYEAE